MSMGTYIVGVTGASGASYARSVLQGLVGAGHHVKLIVTPAGERVVGIELGLRLSGGIRARQEQWTALLEQGIGSIELLAYRDFAASVASGSYPFSAMAVVSCSMGTLARIASGASSNLLERAADVALKEGRPLVLVPRETPLNRIHLKNMLAVSEAGAQVVPAMPAFYSHPRSIEDLVDGMAGRVLDLLGVENNLYRRWQGDPLSRPAAPNR